MNGARAKASAVTLQIKCENETRKVQTQPQDVHACWIIRITGQGFLHLCVHPIFSDITLQIITTQQMPVPNNSEKPP